MTLAKDKKWQVYVNGLFMSGHYTYQSARKEADKFQSGNVEIKTTIRDNNTNNS